MFLLAIAAPHGRKTYGPLQLIQPPCRPSVAWLMRALHAATFREGGGKTTYHLLQRSGVLAESAISKMHGPLAILIFLALHYVSSIKIMFLAVCMVRLWAVRGDCGRPRVLDVDFIIHDTLSINIAGDDAIG